MPDKPQPVPPKGAPQKPRPRPVHFTDWASI